MSKILSLTGIFFFVLVLVPGTIHTRKTGGKFLTAYSRSKTMGHSSSTKTMDRHKHLEKTRRRVP